MSLQVWLPLTKDLRNQGLSNVTVTNNGATYDSDGKLGGCYSFDGSNDYISTICTNYPSIFSNDFSIAFWTYSNDDGSRSVYLGNYGLSGGGNWFNLEKYTNDIIRIWWNDGSPDIRTTTTIKAAEGWVHICITRSGNTFKIYKNGVLNETISNYTISNNIPSTATTFYIGTDYRTSSDIVLKGKLNDVRIYDHCLSPLEVKRLSQGLVLHYPLNRGGWGQENQFKNSNFTNGTNSWYGVNSSSIRVETKDGRLCGTGTKGTSSNIIGQTSAAYTGGEAIDITVSAKVYVTETGTFGVGHWISTTQVSGWQSMSGSRIWNTTNNLSVGWNYISTTLKNATNQYTGSIVTAFSYTGATFWITDIKLEFGQIATPWCPNSSDELATKMGLDDGIEYDTSGFCNNGTRVGDFSWSIDTPRYLVSTEFDTDTSKYIRDVYAIKGLTMNEVSVSLWFNTSSSSESVSGDGENLFSFAYNSGLRARIPKNSTNTIWLYDGAAHTFTSDTSFVDGKWHLLVITFNSGVYKCFIDGTQIGANATKSTSTITFADNEYYRIATSQNGAEHFVGNLSDFRIYATALSDSDILALYNLSGSLDSNGTFHTYEYVEV